MDRSVFAELMKELEGAFNFTCRENTVNVYWKYLKKKFTNREFRETVTEIIEKYDRFPKISDILIFGNKQKDSGV